MSKIAGSRSESESGAISQRHGSADPDPHQYVMDPQHWHLLTCGGGPEDGLIPGEEGAQGEVGLPGDEV
jgi:hypothetical protein